MELTVKCISCGTEWKKPTEASHDPDDFSSSFCPACFRAVASRVIHKHQRREGNFACFGTAADYCDRTDCKYLRHCLA